ncbi:MAG: serine acetyltransferase [Termitinemataceae bacterium]|nr:MAG: serine acetyltransferase [Termitinemataceae bacterium]
MSDSLPEIGKTLTSGGQTSIKTLVDRILESYNEVEATIKVDSLYQLNRSAIIDVIDKLRRLIFPGYFAKKYIGRSFLEYQTGTLIEEVFFNFTKQIDIALRHKCKHNMQTAVKEQCVDSVDNNTEEKARGIVFAFLSKLPHIRKLLATDVDATFDGDPAAFSRDEIISSYPGIYAIMVNRLAHELYSLDVPLIPRVMTEHAHNITGIDIHPGATIGDHFFIDHGTGIVIGETTIIGSNVKIYQGVTLGGLSTRGGQSLKGVKRHPTIEDNVTIYSGASILGGNTVIGNGVIIGSNAFVTQSVPEKTRVSVKNPELRMKASEGKQAEHKEFEQESFWDWVI